MHTYKIRLFFGVQFATAHILAPSLRCAIALVQLENPHAVAGFDPSTGRILFDMTPDRREAESMRWHAHSIAAHGGYAENARIRIAEATGRGCAEQYPNVSQIVY